LKPGLSVIYASGRLWTTLSFAKQPKKENGILEAKEELTTLEIRALEGLISGIITTAGCPISAGLTT